MRCILFTFIFLAFSCASTRDASLRMLVAHELASHPGAGIQDIYKLLYQGEYGVGHIIASREAAADYLNEELASMPKLNGDPLIEPCAGDGSMIRVNLRPFVERKYSAERLIDAMMETAGLVKGDRGRFEAAWKKVREFIELGYFQFPLQEYDAFTAEMKAKNFPYGHHSKAYEERYKPAYRVLLRSAFEKYFPEAK
jgi:hypothetical protein